MLQPLMDGSWWTNTPRFCGISMEGHQPCSTCSEDSPEGWSFSYRQWQFNQKHIPHWLPSSPHLLPHFPASWDQLPINYPQSNPCLRETLGNANQDTNTHTHTRARTYTHSMCLPAPPYIHTSIHARAHTGTAHTSTDTACTHSHMHTHTAYPHAGVTQETWWPHPAPPALGSPHAQRAGCPAVGSIHSSPGPAAPASCPAPPDAAPCLETKEKQPNDVLCSTQVLLSTVLTQPLPSAANSDSAEKMQSAVTEPLEASLTRPLRRAHPVEPGAGPDQSLPLEQGPFPWQAGACLWACLGHIRPLASSSA